MSPPQSTADSSTSPRQVDFSPAFVDVVLVTVNENEDDAVIDLFGECGHFSVNGETYLRLAPISGIEIVRVLSEMGSSGLGASLQTVDQAIRDLHPACVIAVGISFGVDSASQHIGDVLISKRLIPYELQRVTQTGTETAIEVRGERPHADVNLLKKAREAWAKLRRSKAESDPSTLGAITARFGDLLSGEKLVDSIDYREQLKSLAPKLIIGGEMEGSGVYVASTKHKTSWIVIKAICDWADGNKNNPSKEQFQKAAARNAALFTKFMLETVGLPTTSRGVANRKTAAEVDGPPGSERRVQHPPPLLSLRSIAGTTERSDRSLRFLFRTRATRLIGRRAEYQALLDFCLDKPTAKFQWWTLLGSAGCGKSRIAFDLVLELRERGWLADFMHDVDANAESLRTSWYADRPTLLVVDYASKYATQLHNAFLSMTRKSGDYHYPVRILLIERDVGDWYQTIFGSPDERADLVQSVHGQQLSPLHLGALPDGEMEQLVQDAIVAFSGMDPAKPTMPQGLISKLCKKLKIEARPLFALFVADAILAGLSDELLRWNEKDLLDYVVEREARRWREKLNTSELHHSILCFATLVGGVDITSSERVPQYLAKLLTEAYEADPKLDERLSQMTGTQERGNRINPLEPDIIGELFVLTRVPKPPSNEFQDQRQQEWGMFIQAAWSPTCSWGTADFLWRAFRDFPNRRDSLVNLLSARHSDLIDMPSRHKWALALVGNIAKFFPNEGQGFDLQFLANVMGHIAQLGALSAQFSDDRLLRMLWVRAASNVVQGPLALGDEAKAKELHEQIFAIAEGHQGEHDLIGLWARASLGLIMTSLLRGNADEAERLNHHVTEQCRKYPDNAELRARRAALSLEYIRMIYRFDPIAAVREFESLRSMAQSYPQDKAVMSALVSCERHFPRGRQGTFGGASR